MSVLADLIAVASIDLLDTQQRFKVLLEFAALGFIVNNPFTQKLPELMNNAGPTKKDIDSLFCLL